MSPYAMIAVAAIAAGLGYFARMRQAAPAAPAVMVAVKPVPVAASTAPAQAAPPPAAPVVARSSEPVEAVARQPPVPQEVSADSQTLYGAVYDLATLAPVNDAEISVRMSGGGELKARTNAHGWYRLDVPLGSLEKPATVLAAKRGYRRAWQERDPPLASLPPGRRRALPIESNANPIAINLWSRAPRAELDLALEPFNWPDGFAQPDFADAVEPEPPMASGGQCSLFGVAFDIVTKKPVRGAQIGVKLSEQPDASARVTTTDAKGRYVLRMPLTFLQGGAQVVPLGRVAGYQNGFAADRDPSLLTLPEAERRRMGPLLELGSFDAPEECPDAIVQLNLAFVPER